MVNQIVMLLLLYLVMIGALIFEVLILYAFFEELMSDNKYLTLLSLGSTCANRWQFFGHWRMFNTCGYVSSPQWAPAIFTPLYSSGVCVIVWWRFSFKLHLNFYIFYMKCLTLNVSASMFYNWQEIAVHEIFSLMWH